MPWTALSFAAPAALVPRRRLRRRDPPGSSGCRAAPTTPPGPARAIPRSSGAANMRSAHSYSATSVPRLVAVFSISNDSSLDRMQSRARHLGARIRAWWDGDPARVTRRTAVASIGLWLAVPVLAAGLVGSTVLRSGARSYVACWLLLVAWFVLARTKTLRWSSVARLFVAGVPVAVLAAFVTEVLAALADLDVTESGAAIGIAGTVEELAKLTPLAVLCLVAPGRVRRFSLVDWALVGRGLGPRLPGHRGRRPPHLVVGDRSAPDRRRRPVGRPALGVPPLPLVAAERQRRHRWARGLPRPPRLTGLDRARPSAWPCRPAGRHGAGWRVWSLPVLAARRRGREPHGLHRDHGQPDPVRGGRQRGAHARCSWCGS